MSEENIKKPVVGITLGDYNGIGPEIILKVLLGNPLGNKCALVVYGSSKVLNRYRHIMQMKDFPIHSIQYPKQANPKHASVINCWQDQQLEVKPGVATKEAGAAAFQCLERAVKDLNSGDLDVLVTAPINKDTIQSDQFKFPGHTEFLAQAFGKKEALMFMVSDKLRVGVLTGHLPLSEVSANLTREKLQNKIKQMLTSLSGDFGIVKPSLAVLGLNPHAGENGLLGNEEKEIIIPVLESAREKGDLVFGPFSADGFFGSAQFSKYDAVLAMYHDQGLIPFKALTFNNGVNFTAGLPVVRTSPDHGTAYNMAGKNLAEAGSLFQAIFLACDVWKYRKESAAMLANKLPKTEESKKKSNK